MSTTLTSRRGCGFVSLLRGPRDDTLAAFSPLWRISDVIFLGQTGDFVPTQTGVRILRFAPLDQGDLRQRVGSVGAIWLSCFHGAYLVKEDVCHAVSGVNFNHTIKMCLGFLKKPLG